MHKNIQLIDLGLYLKKQRALVIADLHIGYEGALNRQGILIPRFQFKDLMKRLEKMLKIAEPKTIIINGDIKHEFGSISDQEWRDTIKVIDLLSEHGKVILVKGNHDTVLGPIAKKRNIAVMDHFSADGIYICHGHVLPDDHEFKSSKTIIIGHEHPAVTLSKDGRMETFKCFLFGKYRKKELIVLPSFNLVTEGIDILSDKLLSPFLQDIEDFRVMIVSDRTYDFGMVEDLR